MASIDIGPSSGGRGKPLNVEYNLVPFIDLLSCLIAFLLMTAVWQQIAMIQTNEGTSSGQTTRNDFTLALYVYNDRQDLAIGDKSTISLKKIKGQYDLPGLQRQLATLKAKYPNKKDILILTQDKVVYKDLISTMDTVIGSDLPNITLSGMLE